MADESEQQSFTVRFPLAEYAALRDEILKRMEHQHLTLSLGVIAPGTLFAAGIQGKSGLVILVYPVLALFLAISWASANRQIEQIGAYIKERIETRAEPSGQGWQHFWSSVRLRACFAME